MKYLYHGSIKPNIKILQPMSSKVIDDEKAVFATDEKYLCVFFIARLSDNDVDLGYVNNIPIATEQYPGAFDKMKNIDGYIYYLDASNFINDSRLGMQGHEFISYTKQKVIKEEYIPDVYEYLIKSDLNMIDYFEKMEILADHIMKVNN